MVFACFLLRSKFASKKNAHKMFREALARELVQALLDQRTNPNMELSRSGRRPTLDAKRPKKGKPFSEHAQVKKRFFVCSHLKKQMANVKIQKQNVTAESGNHVFA